VSYSTILVHIDLDQKNDARLRVAGDLAERFNARVIGVAAQAEILPVFYTADGYAAGFIAEDNLADIKQRVLQAEERFRGALTGRAKQLEWRTSLEEPGEFIAEQSRAADLVLIGKTPSDETQEPIDQISPSDVIGHIGRPLLIVPHDARALLAERIIVAWKDTREARRAAFDALPFLKKAQQVIVYEVDENHDPAEAQRHVDDVARWLGSHGVNAAGRVEALRDSPALQVEALAKKEAADLIVAGAFGHGKLREWILGGVTRDLLGQSSCCQLLAH
jgi:nucleotide-binding universal stress UspA family protein